MQENSSLVDPLSAELTALRTAARLVANGAAPETVLGSVAAHLAAAVGADVLEILQFDVDESPRQVASWAASPLHASHHSVSVPVFSGDQPWGAVVAHSAKDHPLSSGVEERLSGFAALIGSSVAGSSARSAAVELAADQSALLRVTQLVALGAAPQEVFAVVAEELGTIMNVTGAKLLSYGQEGTATFLASWGGLEAVIPAGAELSVTGTSVTGRIFTTGRTARVDDYTAAQGQIAAILRGEGMRSAAGAPIFVDGRLWGALLVGSDAEAPLPPDAETRMAAFADLVAVAVSNLQARDSLRAIADEHAALRRVATVVAREDWPITPDTIVGEVQLLLKADGAVILRYEPDETVTVLAARGAPNMKGYVDQRLPLAGDNAAEQVWRTRLPARHENFSRARGQLAELTRQEGITGVVATPIIVDDQLWGAIVVVTVAAKPLPPDTEERIGQFTELVATAIGNMKSRLELIESRARIVQTADLTRRRFERDLHDGIQQRLVSITLDLHGVRASLPAELHDATTRLDGVATQLAESLQQLRELSRGIHPAILSEGGLGPAVRALARRSPVPATVHLPELPRLADPVEVAAYYVVSEALANTGKHAQASRVDVTLRRVGGRLEVMVADDGRGGADPSTGTGLIGLTDRVEALGGTLTVRSPSGQGTQLVAALPAPE